MTNASSTFSEEYGEIRAGTSSMVRETPDSVPEHIVQSIWYDRLYSAKNLQTTDGKPLRVVSPGWWNSSEGPDFRGAQIEFGDRLRVGDVEIHKTPGEWRAHRHDQDPRYENVMLHVVLDVRRKDHTVRTASARPIPTLELSPYIEGDLGVLAEGLEESDFTGNREPQFGECARFVANRGPEQLVNLLNLAGEWRLLYKARAFRERMERMGAEQALYESFMAACGFSRFKHQFRAVAREMHYERVGQLAQEDTLLVETALLQLAGLLPKVWPGDGEPPPHFQHLDALRGECLPDLKSLPIEWKRLGVRPNNYPERRLAGAARFVARTATKGMAETLMEQWQSEVTTPKLRKEFEDLFPAAMGFWSQHCTWTGKSMQRPTQLLGKGRVRSILGNVFIPAGLAWARQRRDRVMEERIFAFFAKLPAEPENQVQRIMVPRVFGNVKPPRIDFRKQQGMLQLFQDWCEPNPSCENCSVQTYLEGTTPAE